MPALAPGLYTCIKSLKMCIKSDFEEIILKLATYGQRDKGFLLTSNLPEPRFSYILISILNTCTCIYVVVLCYSYNNIVFDHHMYKEYFIV